MAVHSYLYTINIFLLNALFIYFLYAHTVECGNLASMHNHDHIDNLAERTDNFNGKKKHDVCVLGAGSGGLSFSALLKQRHPDLNILVLEKEGVIGGHCNTRFFTPPAGESVNWVDLGVEVFINTSTSNSLGFGTYILDTAAFVQQFVGPNNVFPYVAPESVGYITVNGATPTLAPLLPPDFGEQLSRFITLLQSEYPWLNVHAYPDPIPPELLVSFQEWILANNFTSLITIIRGFVFNGGLGSFDKLTALYGLANLSPSYLTPIIVPNAYFGVVGGCIQLYNGIVESIGPENVVLNATVMHAKRSHGKPIVLSGHVTNGKGEHHHTFKYKCEKLVVAFPQTLEALHFMDPDDHERCVFSNVETRLYLASEINATGSITLNQAYSINSVNPNNPPFDFAILPELTQVTRDLTYGPSTGQASSDDPNVSVESMTAIIEKTLADISSNTTLFNATLLEVVKHVSQPHFKAHALAQSPSPYTQLDALQGHRNTFYTGALVSFPDSATIWNKNLEIINLYFN